MLKKISKLQLLRFISQVIFLIFIPELFTLIFSQLKRVYLMVLKGNFNILSIWPQLVAFFIIISITIILGRFFCGWFCTFGALNDFIYTISKKMFKTKYLVNEKLDAILKYFKYVILLFIVLVIWTSSLSLFDSYSPWDAFAQVDNLSEAIVKYTGGFIILAIIAVGAIFIERFFCRYLCPLGAIFTILSKCRIFKIKKLRDNCGECRICTNNCSMGINLSKMDNVSSGECINCFKCIDVCPRQNPHVSICGEKVNPLLPSVIAIAAFTGLYTLGGIMSDKIAQYPENSNDVAVSNNKLANKLNPEQKRYKDGVYTGIGEGKSPNLKVSVTIKNNKISGIEILSSNETKGKEAINIIPNEIIASQITKVDGVSGATLTSKGVMMAVNDALKKAPIRDLATDNSSLKQKKYKDGSYTGIGNGKNPNLKVSVTVNNDIISSVEILSSKETKGEQAFKVIPNEIKAAQSTKVDGVSGATLTSDGIMIAVDDALSKAKTLK